MPHVLRQKRGILNAKKWHLNQQKWRLSFMKLTPAYGCEMVGRILGSFLVIDEIYLVNIFLGLPKRACGFGFSKMVHDKHIFEKKVNKNFL